MLNNKLFTSYNYLIIQFIHTNSTLIHKLICITLFSSNSQAYSHESAKNNKITRCDENKLIS